MLTTRRSFLKLFGAAIAMPALVKAESLMRLSTEIVVPEIKLDAKLSQRWNNLVTGQEYAFRVYYRDIKAADKKWVCLTQIFKAETPYATFTLSFPSDQMMVANATLENGPQATPYYNPKEFKSGPWEHSNAAILSGDPAMDRYGVCFRTYVGLNDADSDPLRPRIVFHPPAPDDELKSRWTLTKGLSVQHPPEPYAGSILNFMRN